MKEEFKYRSMIMKLLMNSTSLALWYDIIQDAENSCALVFKKEVEAYIVFLMMRYMTRPDIVKQIMAAEFLNSINMWRPAQRESKLQDVGDKCLIFSGLFPQLAAKRLVNISYFVNLGQSAYSSISKVETDLYGSLAKQFVPIMDVIQSLRNNELFPGLSPLEAYELWNETGSQRALATLKLYSQATPVTISSTDTKHIIK
jgi:hypothetical protein